MGLIGRFKRNSRRFLVVLALLLLALKGSRVEQPRNNELVFDGGDQTCSYTGPSQTYSADLGELTITTPISLAANQSYVLAFELRLDEPKTTRFTASSIRSNLEDYSLSLTLLGDGVSQRVEPTMPLKSGGGFQFYDLGFNAQIEANRVRLRVLGEFGENASELFKLTVRDLTINPIDPQLLSSKKSGLVLGGRPILKLENIDFNPNGFASFALGRPILSALFRSETGYIAAVTAALKIKGNGGAGEYEVFIAEVEKTEDSTYKIGTVLNSLKVTAEDLRLYVDERYSVGEKGTKVYTFPITAVVKDKDYVVGIDATRVGYNLEHGLLIGTRAIEEKNILAGKDKSLKKRKGELLLVASEPEQSQNADLATYGSRIIHVSPHKAKFYYQNSHTPLDLLAIDPASIADVRYDNSARIVTAAAKDDNNIIYSINTTYPISYFTIEADQRCDTTVPVELEYSVDDQKSWRPVEEVADIFPFPPGFSSGRVAANKSTKINIKVSYKRDRTGGSGQSYFGLTNLRIYAELETK